MGEAVELGETAEITMMFKIISENIHAIWNNLGDVTIILVLFILITHI
jgi:hypothetical protein